MSLVMFLKNNIKKIIFLVILIVVAIFSSNYLKEYLNTKSQDNSKITSTSYANNYNNIELVQATVTKIIDGDTIWVDIDGNEYKVRFIGVNCPEYTTKIEPYGKEATEYTTNYLMGKTVYLQKDVTDTDKYDRLLRYVWLEKVDEINDETIRNYLFNAKLVIDGMAKSNYYKPNITLQNYLEKYENEAKENKIGMWN